MTYDPSPPAMEVDYSDDLPSPRTRRLRITAAIVALALVAAAGLGFTFGAHSSHPTNPNALNHDPPPSLAGAYSNNLVTAFRALYAYGNWVDQHPSLTLVSRYSYSGTQGYETTQSFVRYLVSHHAHAALDPRGYDGDIGDARVASESAHQVVAVLDLIDVDAYTDKGVYLSRLQSAKEESVLYTLRRNSHGQWLFYASEYSTNSETTQGSA